MYESYPRKKHISYRTFCDIIKTFNKKCTERIIEEDAVLDMGFDLGNIMKVEHKLMPRIGTTNGNLRASINWPASHQKKKDIIARGGTPLQMIKDENGKILGDNGGEEWMIYYTDNKSVRLVWRRYSYIDTDGFEVFPVRKCRRYHYKPADDFKKAVAKKFRENIEEDDLQIRF